MSSAHIVYSSRGGVRYATLMRSVRTGKTTRKEKLLYLGRVLDAERGIYKNKVRGVFAFDPESMAFSPAPADFVKTGKSCDAKEEGRKDRMEELIVDFGDAFLLHELLTRYGLDAAINALQYDNPDTLRALLIYCMLSSRSIIHAPAWYEGSYARILYPGADLANVPDLLALVGQEDVQQRFFDVYFRILPPALREGANILVERTVLPDNAGLTFLGKNGEQVSEEVRLLCMLRQDTGLPIHMRCVCDNEPGSSELVTTVQDLRSHGIDMKFALPDANWLAEQDMRDLLEKKIPFITRCPTNHPLCREWVADHLDTLEAPENLVLDADARLFYGRRIYMKCVPVQDSRGRNLYAYPGKDMLLASVEDRRKLHCARETRMDRQAFHEEGLWHGVFLFLASDKMRPEVLLSTWLAGQEAERLFVSSLPAELPSGEALKGYLLLNFIAKAVLKLLQLELRGSGHSLDEVLACMANQHAKFFEKVVIPARASHAQKAIYDLFDVHPLAKYPRH